MSTQQSAAVSGRLLRSSLRHRQSSATTFRTSLLADHTTPSTYHTRPSGILSRRTHCLELASRPTQETPTALSLHSGSHWRHSSLTSISVLQRIRRVYDYALHFYFTYLLKYLLASLSLFSLHSLLRLERCCAHDATPFLTVICFPPGGVNTKVHWFDVVRDHS